MNTIRRWQLVAALALIGGFAAGYGVSKSTSRPPVVVANVALPSATTPEFEQPLTFPANVTPAEPRDLPQPSADEVKTVEEAVLRALQEPTLIKRLHALFSLVERMEPAQISAAVALAERLNASDREVLLPLLVSRWAEIEPAAALRFALKLPMDLHQPIVRSAVEAWCAQDADAAMAAIAAARGPQRAFALETLIAALAKRDPALALRFSSSFPNLREASAHHLVFSQWALQDPTRAASHALQVTHGKDRLQAILSTVRKWAESDPRAALAWASQIQETEEQQTAIDGALASWASVDATGAAAYIQKLPPGPQRDAALSSVVVELARKDATAGQALIQQMAPGARRTQAIETFTGIWAQHDPAAAAAYLSSMPPGSGLANAMARISREWVKIDVQGALTWVASLPPSGERNTVQQNVTLQWAAADPRAAARYASEQNLDEASFAEAVAFHWAAENAREAFDWAQTLPEGRTKNKALHTVTAKLAARDLPAAANAVFSMPAESQAAAAVQVARRWAASDLRGAATWASQLPQPEAQVDAFRNIAIDAAARDLVQTAKWLETIPKGEARDVAVSEFSRAAADADPAGAVAWASTITDEGTRTDDLNKILSKWMRQDKTAATQWIRSTAALPMEVKQVWLGVSQ